jgi:DNA modification methylase
VIAPDLLPLARPIASLREDPQNARKHDKRNLDAIAKSLSEFGQRKPVVALADGTVVAGNGTLAAARSLGWSDIAVATFEDEQKAKAYAVADNRAGELATWDDDLLVAALSGIDEGLRAACGFSAAELERLLHVEGRGDGDDVPEAPAEPTTKRGDLWLLGEHRLLCGDSTNAADVARVLDGDAPRLLLTDPPYGVELDMEWRDRAGLNGLGPAQSSYMQRAEGHTNTAISGDTRADWSEAFELVPSLDTAYVWHASAFSVEVGIGLRRIGFELKQQIIWRKPHFALSRQHYHWQHEPCWYARKDGAAKFRGSRDQSTIWDAASPKMLMNPAGEREEKVDHPTQKPIALYVRPIENHLEQGECFYEPFGGSGTAIVAAEQTGRRCRAVELDPKYVDVIVARFEKFSGKKADRRPT